MEGFHTSIKVFLTQERRFQEPRSSSLVLPNRTYTVYICLHFHARNLTPFVCVFFVVVILIHSDRNVAEMKH